LANLGDYQGAKEGFLKALEINKNHFGTEHIEYANNLE
jgi:hypothetical protein